MSSEDLRELGRQLRQGQEKYTHLLLAVAGAAIGLAVSQTQNSALEWNQLPLAGAVLCWGCSFFFGCRNLQYVNATLYANAGLLQVDEGTHPNVPPDPESRAAAMDGIKAAWESNNNKANRFAGWQFRFLIFGAILYVSWHVIGMWMRTGAGA